MTNNCNKKVEEKLRLKIEFFYEFNAFRPSIKFSALSSNSIAIERNSDFAFAEFIFDSALL
jgi:hypothetical protein